MPSIVMLEDDHERIDRFTRVLPSGHDDLRFTVRRTAHEFIEVYLMLPFRPDLIALDHDLFTDSPTAPDPGDGRDVARFLADCDAICPVLIHSTNAPAADSMMFTLQDAGWIADRIAPLGSNWIEEYWYPYATRMILGNQDSE
ncbi:MAG: hypothetical protein Aurels2KO_41870 [Aureliella sp.]